MVTSYCPDTIAASELMVDANSGFRVFYDLDTPVTLAELDRGESVPYMEPWARYEAGRFFLGESQYPEEFSWTSNMDYAGHVPPSEHPQFYCSAKLNLS